MENIFGWMLFALLIWFLIARPLKPKTTTSAVFDEMQILQMLPENQRMLFMMEFNTRRKKEGTALLLTALLWGCGAHHFYFGKIGTGILYIILVPILLFISFGFLSPLLLICYISELFTQKNRVQDYNVKLAMDIAGRFNSASPAIAPISP